VVVAGQGDSVLFRMSTIIPERLNGIFANMLELVVAGLETVRNLVEKQWIVIGVFWLQVPCFPAY
jgi:hypothetical protein